MLCKDQLIVSLGLFIGSTVLNYKLQTLYKLLC